LLIKYFLKNAVKKKIVSQIIISDYDMQFKAASGMDFFTLSRRILHGRAGANLARQFQGFTPNNYHILWACQIFGVAGVGCKPNILIIPSEREMSYCN
jgi:hypothetical protein